MTVLKSARAEDMAFAGSTVHWAGELNTSPLLHSRSDTGREIWLLHYYGRHCIGAYWRLLGNPIPQTEGGGPSACYVLGMVDSSFPLPRVAISPTTSTRFMNRPRSVERL